MVSLLHKSLFLNQIIAWDSTVALIPNGWQICDGTNGTPDLRAKFVRGAPNATEEGGTGGSDTVTLVTANMPSHTHTISGTHFHQYGTEEAQRLASQFPSGLTTGSGAMGSPSIANSGSDVTHENKPKFYQVVYIQRVT